MWISKDHRVITTSNNGPVHAENFEELKEALHGIIDNFRSSGNREVEYAFYIEEISIMYRISHFQQSFWDGPAFRTEKPCMHLSIDKVLPQNYSKSELVSETKDFVHGIALKLMAYLPLLKAKAVVEE